MRRPLIAGNWKMYKTVAETLSYVAVVRPLVADVAAVDIVIAPPFTAVHAASAAVRGSNVAIAAQDLYWEHEGAYTGEVSPAMLREAGATHVIIGHSERRTLFGETDASVNRKTQAAIAAGLLPIVCVGETLQQRERNETLQVLDRQLADGLAGLTADQIGAAVIAYEPVWAIGTGRNATPDQAQEAHAHIRRRLAGAAGAAAAEACRVLYGGSVKPANVAEILRQSDVDGALIGGASLDPQSFAEMVRQAQGGRV